MLSVLYAPLALAASIPALLGIDINTPTYTVATTELLLIGMIPAVYLLYRWMPRRHPVGILADHLTTALGPLWTHLTPADTAEVARRLTDTNQTTNAVTRLVEQLPVIPLLLIALLGLPFGAFVGMTDLPTSIDADLAQGLALLLGSAALALMMFKTGDQRLRAQRAAVVRELALRQA